MHTQNPAASFRALSLEKDSGPEMEQHGQQAACVPETHIDDLPDECLLSIMSCLNGWSRLPARGCRVWHLLQCTLICKRWRALADAAVDTLAIHGFDLTEGLARHLGSRFGHLRKLEMMDVTVHGEALVSLARSTPRLELLVLKPSFPGTAPRTAASIPALKLWKSLKRLDIRNNLFHGPSSGDVNLTMESICELKSLQAFCFGCLTTNLVGFCGRIDTMTGLTSLELGCINFPPVAGGHFTRVLTKLVTADVQGTQLPCEVGRLRALEQLHIVLSPSLLSLPETLGQLNALREMSIHECTSLRSLPQSVGSLSNLRTLTITQCPQLSVLPDTMGQLRALQELRLAECPSLRSLPQSVGSLSSLRNLTLTKCPQLSMLPEAIGRFGALRVLCVEGCARLHPLIEHFRQQGGLRIIQG